MEISSKYCNGTICSLYSNDVLCVSVEVVRRLTTPRSPSTTRLEEKARRSLRRICKLRNHETYYLSQKQHNSSVFLSLFCPSPPKDERKLKIVLNFLRISMPKGNLIRSRLYRQWSGCRVRLAAAPKVVCGARKDCLAAIVNPARTSRLYRFRCE